MSSSGKSIALLIAIIFLTSLGTLQLTIVNATSIETNSTYLLPDENATIILLRATSYAESNYYVAHNTSEGYVPSSWLFAIFSTGNGTTGLTISAHDCNVTITSYNYYLQNTGGYNYKTSTWLNYTITGTGTQTLSYSDVHNSTYSNTTVYIDGVARQQGDGWNWANFGISITGAASKVSIFNEGTTFLPPRNPPHLTLWDYILYLIPLFAIIVVLTVTLLLYRKHRKTSDKKE